MFWLRAYGLFLGLLAFLTDQFSKYWVVEKFGSLLSFTAIEILPFFNISLHYNSGISFGLFSNSAESGVWILSGLAIAICLVLLWLMLRTDDNISILSFGLIIGGALGNVADRLAFGAVVDFLDFHVAGYHWPTFNLADAFIFVGVAVLLLANLKLKKA